MAAPPCALAAVRISKNGRRAAGLARVPPAVLASLWAWAGILDSASLAGSDARHPRTNKLFILAAPVLITLFAAESGRAGYGPSPQRSATLPSALTGDHGSERTRSPGPSRRTPFGTATRRARTGRGRRCCARTWRRDLLLAGSIPRSSERWRQDTGSAGTPP